MLKRMPLTTLKIDRSLVAELPHSHEDAVIVRAIVLAGHALGLTVVASGVETEAQRAYLASLGCDEGQGSLFGDPLFAERVRPLLPKLDVTCPVPRSTPETRYERCLPN